MLNNLQAQMECDEFLFLKLILGENLWNSVEIKIKGGCILDGRSLFRSLQSFLRSSAEFLCGPVNF